MAARKNAKGPVTRAMEKKQIAKTKQQAKNKDADAAMKVKQTKKARRSQGRGRRAQKSKYRHDAKDLPQPSAQNPLDKAQPNKSAVTPARDQTKDLPNATFSKYQPRVPTPLPPTTTMSSHCLDLLAEKEKQAKSINPIVGKRKERDDDEDEDSEGHVSKMRKPDPDDFFKSYNKIRFLDLPREIRFMIYDHAMTDIDNVELFRSRMMRMTAMRCNPTALEHVRTEDVTRKLPDFVWTNKQVLDEVMVQMKKSATLVTAGCSAHSDQTDPSIENTLFYKCSHEVGEKSLTAPTSFSRVMLSHIKLAAEPTEGAEDDTHDIVMRDDTKAWMQKHMIDGVEETALTELSAVMALDEIKKGSYKDGHQISKVNIDLVKKLAELSPKLQNVSVYYPKKDIYEERDLDDEDWTSSYEKLQEKFGAALEKELEEMGEKLFKRHTIAKTEVACLGNCLKDDFVGFHSQEDMNRDAGNGAYVKYTLATDNR